MPAPRQKAIIDPKQLLIIELLEADDSTRTYTVFLCRYLAVQQDGHPLVGFEFLFDPDKQESNAIIPRAPYECAFARLVVDPKRLKLVRPYVVAG